MDENKSNLNNQNEPKTLRTYMSDMADAVRANEVSVIKVALAEQNKKTTEELYKKIEGSPSKKVFWFVGGLIFIGVAVYASYFLLQQKEKNSVIEVETKVESIIGSDETSAIILADNEKLLDKIKSVEKVNSSSGVNGSIKFVPVSKNVDGVEKNLSMYDLSSALSFTAPSSLIRSLGDTYMIGFYNKDSLSKFFFIFQTKDYEYSYAGMLEWESTLAGDMAPLFNNDSTQDNEWRAGGQWKDIIINNKDARVLTDTKGRPMLYYLFTDKSNIIIADSDVVIKEIIKRLTMKK